MRKMERLFKLLVLFGAFSVSAYFALQFGSGGLWRGIEPAFAVGQTGGKVKVAYDLTKLKAVTATIQTIRDKYVDPKRVKPREMLLSALDFVQRDVAQVIVLRSKDGNSVTIQVGPKEKKFSVGDVLGPWDVSARLRDVFVFLQAQIKDDPEVDLRKVEYAACNGILHTLDPHSVFMSPEAYREMTISTRGAFGGVGIVISIRDQMLTVIKPMPDTPAGRAGLKRYDRIMKINNESTLNMPLDAAVRRLRGEPGTPVIIDVHRDNPGGWSGTRPFKLVREIINVKSVESRLLDQGVGYIRIKQFQSSTTRDLDIALSSLHRREPRLRGVVLDLRSNPGGLLDQAAKVADRFIRKGTLVATVSASEPREEKRAHAPGTEPDYPLVVLVNPSSASASEIVAGALKNHNRAVIVGQRSFGKGSVQLVFPRITREKAALKLTVAQYLTPGDISIQTVGITPDVMLDPMTVDPLDMDITRRPKRFRERDLSKHLSNARVIAAQKPLEIVRYDLPETEREQMRERGGDPRDTFTKDFPIQFAHDLVLHLPADTLRVEAVQKAASFIEKVRQAELEKVSAELSKLHVDWSPPPKGVSEGPDTNDYQVSVKTDQPNNTVPAGGKMQMTVTVTNNSKKPVYQLRALTKSDSSYYGDRELIFGKIDPGKSATASAFFGWCDTEGHRIGSTHRRKGAKRVCTIPKDASTRSDGVHINFFAASGKPPAPAELRPTVTGLPRPVFIYAYQILDNGPGANGDGQLQPGEHVAMFLTVKNIGKGRSYETQANLRNLSGDGVSLQAGRFDISNMKPGDVRSVTFAWQVRKAIKEDKVKIELIVGDRDLNEFVDEKIDIPLSPPTSITPKNAVVKIAGKDVALMESLNAATRPFAVLTAGTLVHQSGKRGPLAKIDLGQHRFAFIPESSLVPAPGKTAPTSISFDTIFSHAPPIISMKTAALAVRGPTVKVTGDINDKTKLRDAYMFLGSHKIFYRSNQKAKDPHAMHFSLDVPLKPGMNAITLVARHDATTISRRVLMIRRDGPKGQLLERPKNDDTALLRVPWASPPR